MVLSLLSLRWLNHQEGHLFAFGKPPVFKQDPYESDMLKIISGNDTKPHNEVMYGVGVGFSLSYYCFVLAWPNSRTPMVLLCNFFNDVTHVCL
jgi:hypothetical protein